jgi:ParB-like chromosome segregation protein Spo0J
MSKINNLNVKYVPVKSLKEYVNNTKLHSVQQLKQIQKSIKQFYFINPILIDENNEIIAGHGRLRAAIELGMEKIPAIQLNHLTDIQKKAYRIADNKLTENGEWNIELLKIEFLEIEKLDIDFELDITGFKIGEIDVMLQEEASGSDINDTAVPFISEMRLSAKRAIFRFLETQNNLWQCIRRNRLSKFNE